MAELLCDKNPNVRRCACEALPKLGEAAAPHAAAMAELLRDDHYVVREAAIRALANLGVAAAPHAVQASAELLCDKDPTVRRCACGALAKLGEAAAPHAAAMAESVRISFTTRTHVSATSPSMRWENSDRQQHRTPRQ
jgi:bilin biosynthesis protein